MPFGDIYASRVVTMARGIQMLNTFHFEARGALMTANDIVQEVLENIIPNLKAVTSAYTQFIEVNASIQNNELQDNYAKLLENEFGLIPATTADPRLGVWIQTRSNFTDAPYGTGGFCWGAPPYNWAQDAPMVNQQCIEQWKDFRNFMFNLYRHDRVNRVMTWGVFSRANHRRYPDQKEVWWFPITDMHIRAHFVTRRTRRPRHPA